MIYFTYEIETDRASFEFKNLVGCEEPRVLPSPVISTFYRRSKTMDYNYSSLINVIAEPPTNAKYVISIGVGYSPDQWCGPDSKGNGYCNKWPNSKNLFSYINAQSLTDLQIGKAYLLIDQTQEGYQTSWLWDWFYNSCEEYNINPKQIIYLTGNMNSLDQYNSWAINNNISADMLIIPWPHFENTIWEISTGYTEYGVSFPNKLIYRKLPDFDHHISFKKWRGNGIKTFNILQKRTRSHRLWFYKHLFEAGLIENNIVSMNQFELNQTFMEGRTMNADEHAKITKCLPIHPDEVPDEFTPDIFASHDGWKFILAINDITMVKTWCTVVSEASCSDLELSCFLSEKTFKPIVCQHPFIIMGSRGSLKHLQNLGYKTFHPYINEDYDDLPTWERMDAVVREMKRIDSFTLNEKFEWLLNIEGILKYNHRHMKNRFDKYVSTIYNSIKTHMEK